MERGSKKVGLWMRVEGMERSEEGESKGSARGASALGWGGEPPQRERDRR